MNKKRSELSKQMWAKRDKEDRQYHSQMMNKARWKNKSKEERRQFMVRILTGGDRSS